MKRSIPIVFALMVLGLATFAKPVLATTFTVTKTLERNGHILWTWTRTVEVEDDTITIRVPWRVYDLIVERHGTDTFTTPFSITTRSGFTLHVESDPSGLTYVFEPRYGLP